MTTIGRLFLTDQVNVEFNNISKALKPIMRKSLPKDANAIVVRQINDGYAIEIRWTLYWDDSNDDRAILSLSSDDGWNIVPIPGQFLSDNWKNFSSQFQEIMQGSAYIPQ